MKFQKVTLRAADPVGQQAAERPRQRADQRPEEGDRDRDRRELRLDQQRERRRVADEGAERPDVEEGHDPGVLALDDRELVLESRPCAEVRLFMKKTAPNTAIAIGSIHIRPAFCR